MTRVHVLNGPNLGRLGTRQVDVYGTTSYQSLVDLCLRTGSELGLDVDVRQTDAEHEMLAWLHAAADEEAAVVLNPGAWSHYSYAIRDALELFEVPVIEVHLSDIEKREEWRRHSVIADVVAARILGKGPDGYREALDILAKGTHDRSD
jgi:3-dehydroquinate dehydratase-2